VRNSGSCDGAYSTIFTMSLQRVVRQLKANSQINKVCRISSKCTHRSNEPVRANVCLALRADIPGSPLWAKKQTERRTT
jgi:hypothetical protein